MSEELKPEVEFMMRVRLPDSSSFASCPSGDTDYAIAHREALKKALPEGFEIIKERPEERRPITANGFTYVRLRPTSADVWQKKCDELQNENNKLRQKLEQINKLSS